MDLLYLPIAMLIGTALGAFAGLLPGVHVNNTSAVLLGLAPALAAAGLEPLCVAVIIVASMVAQSFFDVVPAVFIGVPDEATVLAVLPGHRLLLEGRGIEAVHLSAIGSGLGILVSLALILPLSVLFRTAYPLLQNHMALILLGISAFILISGPLAQDTSAAGRLRSLCWAIAVFSAAGLLGLSAFSIEPVLVPLVNVVAPSVLLPLLSGLFGAPALLLSLGSAADIPYQSSGKISLPRGEVLGSAWAGAVAGALVAWFPAVSTGVATSITGLGRRRDTGADRRYLVTISGVNTASAVFSLVALYVIGRPRSGAVATAQEVLGGSIGLPDFALLLGVVCATGVLSYLLTLRTGRMAARVCSRLDTLWINRSVLGFLAIMCVALTGVAGLAIFLTGTAVGLSAHVINVRKTCLMGVLLVPCILYFL